MFLGLEAYGFIMYDEYEEMTYKQVASMKLVPKAFIVQLFFGGLFVDFLLYILFPLSLVA